MSNHRLAIREWKSRKCQYMVTHRSNMSLHILRVPNIFMVWPQVITLLQICTCRLMRANMLCDKNLIVHSLFFLLHLSAFVSLVSITWQVCLGTSDWISSVLVSALKNGGSNTTFVCLSQALKINNGNKFSNRICFRPMTYSQSVHCCLLVLLMLTFNFFGFLGIPSFCIVFLRRVLTSLLALFILSEIAKHRKGLLRLLTLTFTRWFLVRRQWLCVWKEGTHFCLYTSSQK